MVFSQDRADIALLKLKVFDPDLPHAVLGDSDRLALGQRTFVVGSPAGLERMFLNREGLAQVLNQDLEGGLLVLGVAKDSPAESAGLKGGWLPAVFQDFAGI